MKHRSASENAPVQLTTWNFEPRKKFHVNIPQTQTSICFPPLRTRRSTPQLSKDKISSKLFSDGNTDGLCATNSLTQYSQACVLENNAKQITGHNLVTISMLSLLVATQSWSTSAGRCYGSSKPKSPVCHGAFNDRLEGQTLDQQNICPCCRIRRFSAFSR